MVEPTHFTAKIQEPAVRSILPRIRPREQLPTYNAYSIDGDVTAPLRLCQLRHPRGLRSARKARDIGKGRHRDRALRQLLAGNQAEGRGRARRSRVPDLFGSARRRVRTRRMFPAGPMRPPDGVQRGSVMDMPVYPGDPLTPGMGAVPGAKRLALKEVPTLTKIPVMPISYARRAAVVAALTGPMAAGLGVAGCPSRITSVPERRRSTSS